MASTFTTNFGIEKIGTGEQSGTWGTTTNFNIDILDRITSYKSVTLSDAATATLTVRAGSPSSGSSNVQDGMYRVIKFGGTLSQACTITISPSTTTAYFIIQNGTSGSQNIIIKQGSGAQTVTIANGKADIVYADASDEVISIGSKLGVSFDIVNDTSPQLGGDLDMNGQDIVTTSNADIELAPNGTGKTVLKGNTNPGTMVFNCESNSHGQTVKSQPHSASVTNVLTLPPGGDQEIVGTTATQTLTNKTIGVGQLSGQVAIANGGTGSSSLAGANIAVLNSTNNFADNILQRAQLKDYAETVHANGTKTSAFNLDLENGNVHSFTIGSGTFNVGITNSLTSHSNSITCIITNGGAGTITFKAGAHDGGGNSVKFAGGSAPTLTSSGTDILTFITFDGGTNYFGFAAGLAMA